MNDITPELLEKIEQLFDERVNTSEKLKEAVSRLKLNKANYVDANNFAIEVGEILSNVFNETIDASILPDGRMYYNIADRILNPTMKKNHELITGYTKDVQTNLNKKSGLHLRAQIPELNQDRIDGIIERISNETDFDVIKWILGDPIVNFSHSVVDDSIKANADFQYSAGLQPMLTRKVRGKACKWCRNLAGTYDYDKRPADIFKRHENCRCTVEFDPKDGRGIQNSHTKVWRDPDKSDKIEARKTLGRTKEELERKILSGHKSTPKEAQPRSVIDHVGKDNKIDVRTFYDDNGLKSVDIHTTNHGNPKRHPYGEHGEHAHDYEWDPEKKLKNKAVRNLTSEERKENSDII